MHLYYFLQPQNFFLHFVDLLRQQGIDRYFYQKLLHSNLLSYLTYQIFSLQRSSLVESANKHSPAGKKADLMSYQILYRIKTTYLRYFYSHRIEFLRKERWIGLQNFLLLLRNSVLSGNMHGLSCRHHGCNFAHTLHQKPQVQLLSEFPNCLADNLLQARLQ